MKLVRSPGLHPALIFIAPALDVILSLIFFIILSTSFLLQPGIAVSVPQSPFLLAPQRDPQIISVTAAPVPAIYFDDAEVSAPELREKLQAQGSRKRTIIIKADRQTPFDKVNEVLTIALELGFPAVIATSEAR